MVPTGKKKIFDDEWMNDVFPKQPTYYESAPRRQRGETHERRGFDYVHGTRVDESASEEE